MKFLTKDNQYFNISMKILVNALLVFSQKTVLTSLDDKIKQILTTIQKAHPHDIQRDLGGELRQILTKEKVWQKWKETKCENYEKPINIELRDMLKSLKEKKKKKSERVFSESVKRIKKQLADSRRVMLSQGGYDQTINLFSMLETSKLTVKLRRKIITNLNKLSIFLFTFE